MLKSKSQVQAEESLSLHSTFFFRFPLKAAYLSTLKKARIIVCIPFFINAAICTIFFYMKSSREFFDKRKGMHTQTLYLYLKIEHWRIGEGGTPSAPPWTKISSISGSCFIFWKIEQNRMLATPLPPPESLCPLLWGILDWPL